MKKWLKQLDKLFEDLFVKKAPGLSGKVKEWLVKAIPWLALIFGIIAVPGLLAAFGFGAITAPFWILGGGRTVGYLVGVLTSLAQVVMQLMAVSFLFKKAIKGWQLLYWGTLLGLVSAIFHISGFGIIMSAVSLYLLYQIKSYYK